MNSERHIFIYCRTRSLDGKEHEHYMHRYPDGKAYMCNRIPVGDTELAAKLYTRPHKALVLRVSPLAFNNARLRFRERGDLIGDIRTVVH